MRLTWIGLAVMSVAVLVGCREEVSPPPDVNLIYGEFFKAFTRSFGVDSTNGNFVVHHGGDAALGTLVIHSKTQVPGSKRRDLTSWDALKRNLSSLRRITYDDFWARNAQRQDVTLKTAGSWTIRILQREEHAEIVAADKEHGLDDYWKVFHERFPGGQLTGISAPGISRDGSQILIYLYSGFGPLAASASYYLMEKKEGVWQIKEEWMLWVS